MYYGLADVCINLTPTFCPGLHEIWEDGQAFKDLYSRLRTLADNRASIEAARKVH